MYENLKDKCYKWDLRGRCLESLAISDRKPSIWTRAASQSFVQLTILVCFRRFGSSIWTFQVFWSVSNNNNNNNNNDKNKNKTKKNKTKQNKQTKTTQNKKSKKFFFSAMYAPNLHKVECYNVGSYFIGCSYVLNLSVNIGMALLSVIVLKLFQIWIFVYSPNLHNLRWYSFGLCFIECGFVTNLSVDVGMAPLSVIILKLFQI